ncbi:MAG: S-layer homology domain-containing protein, partial [Clostridia bacterium]
VAKGTDVSDTKYMMGLTEDFFEATGEKSGNYSVTWVVNDGWLQITKAERPVDAQIDATDYDAPYDGNAHGITVNGDILPGDIVYYSTTNNGSDWSNEAPSRTDAQNSEIIYVKVENPNYKTATAEGTITIAKRNITITADSAEKTYDGEALTKNSFTTTVPTEKAPHEGLVPGQTVTAVVSGSQTRIGSSDNTVGSAVIKAGDTDVTDNYYILYKKGTLSVTGAESLTVTKTPAQTDVTTGGTITWKVTVRNNGKEDVCGLNLTDSMDGVIVTAPDGVDLTNFSLSAGGKVEITVTYENAAVGIYTNHIEVSQPKYDPDNNNAAEKIAECDSESVIVSKPLDPPIGPDDPALNTKDHVAYIIGYPDLTVRPGENITRGEVATIFFRLLTDKSRNAYWSQHNAYSDVDASFWYNNAISTLTNAGVLSGYPDGTFRPDEPISRAEFASIAARFSKTVYNGRSSFSDVGGSHWASRFISLAEYLGWISGYPDGTFRPDQTINRAEAMTLVNRVLEREVKAENMLQDMQVWPDNQPGDWHYEAVQEATNSHEYVRTDQQVPDHDFCYEKWQEILEVPDWAALEKTWSILNSKQRN